MPMISCHRYDEIVSEIFAQKQRERFSRRQKTTANGEIGYCILAFDVDCMISMSLKAYQ